MKFNFMKFKVSILNELCPRLLLRPHLFVNYNALSSIVITLTALLYFSLVFAKMIRN